MARRLLRLATIAAATAQQQTQTTTTFQQGAKKEWSFGDNQYKRVRDAVKPRTGGGMEDERWKLDDRSECYSGTDEYMLRSVFCDAECLSDNKNDPSCAGPWYCARTKVCEEFHDPDNRDNVDPENRKCAIIRSCANHSQCYPTAAEQKAMGVSTVNADLTNLDDTPFKYEIAGFTVETTCCVNKKAYKHDVDIPCNAAARRGVAVAALVALLGVAIV